jgi:hypothetical protein
VDGELSSVREAVKRGTERVKLKEFLLSETVARERLVKTQQAGKCLAFGVVICALWRLSVAL